MQDNFHSHGLSLELVAEKDYHFDVMVAHKPWQNKSELRVVGIDQALRNVGVCLNYGGKLTALLFKEPNSRGAERLSSLRRRILLHTTAHMPDLVAMEGYSFNSTHRAFDLGEIGGILKVEFHDLKIPVIVIPPKQLKLFVTGDGDASKDKVIKYVAQRYRYLTANDNIADAIGLAKFAEIYMTGRSRYRCELETTARLKAKESAPPTKKIEYRRKKRTV